MSRFLLDSDSCIGILNGSSPALVDALRQRTTRQIVLSSVVKAELLYGARHSRQVDDNLALLAEFFTAFESLPFDDRAAEHAGLVRAQLAAAGTPIGPNDLLIAATALANDVTLVSRNTREFSRVPGLRLVDWSEPAAS